VLLAALWLAQRISRARTIATSAGLIDHGFLETKTYPIGQIKGFATAKDVRWATTRVIVHGRGSRLLMAGYGRDRDSEESTENLEQWLRTGGRRAPGCSFTS
jgi:hypothetical protein